MTQKVNLPLNYTYRHPQANDNQLSVEDDRGKFWLVRLSASCEPCWEVIVALVMRTLPGIVLVHRCTLSILAFPNSTQQQARQQTKFYVYNTTKKTTETIILTKVYLRFLQIAEITSLPNLCCMQYRYILKIVTQLIFLSINLKIKIIFCKIM